MAEFLYSIEDLESRKPRKGRIFRAIHPPHFLNGVQEVAGLPPRAPQCPGRVRLDQLLRASVRHADAASDPTARQCLYVQGEFADRACPAVG